MIKTCSSLSLFPVPVSSVILCDFVLTKTTHIITVVDIQCTSTFSINLFVLSFPCFSLSFPKTVRECLYAYSFSFLFLSLPLFHSGCINKTRKKQYCWCVTTAMKIFITVCVSFLKSSLFFLLLYNKPNRRRFKPCKWHHRTNSSSRRFLHSFDIDIKVNFIRRRKVHF